MDNQNNDTNKAPNSGLFSNAGPAPTPATAPAEAAPPQAPEPEEAPGPTDAEIKEVLMGRARLMGIEFSNNIGIETLRERIRAKQDALEAAEKQAESRAETEFEDEPEDPVVQEPNPLFVEGDPEPAPAPVVAVKKSLRQEIHDREMRLVRCRITCMDPKKKDLHGEIFTIANEFLGTVRKFVPFGEVTEDGFHIPFCIYTMMDERRFLNIRVRKDPRTGREVVESNYAREFALEVLPPLTERELNQLATAQAAAGSIDSGLQ